MTLNISSALRREVIQRAEGRCEYCRLHHDLSIYTHFDLPVLSLEEIEAQMAIQKTKPASNCPPNLSLEQVMAELGNDDLALEPN